MVYGWRHCSQVPRYHISAIVNISYDVSCGTKSWEGSENCVEKKGLLEPWETQGETYLRRLMLPDNLTACVLFARLRYSSIHFAKPRGKWRHKRLYDHNDHNTTCLLLLKSRSNKVVNTGKGCSCRGKFTDEHQRTVGSWRPNLILESVSHRGRWKERDRPYSSFFMEGRSLEWE